MPINRQQFSSVGVTVCLLFFLGGAGVAMLLQRPLIAAPCALAGIYFLFAIKVVDQWEKVAVLRFGKYRGLRGPGLIFIIPSSRRSAATWTSACA